MCVFPSQILLWILPQWAPHLESIAGAGDRDFKPIFGIKKDELATRWTKDEKILTEVWLGIMLESEMIDVVVQLKAFAVLARWLNIGELACQKLSRRRAWQKKSIRFLGSDSVHLPFFRDEKTFIWLMVHNPGWYPEKPWRGRITGTRSYHLPKTEQGFCTL